MEQELAEFRSAVERKPITLEIVMELGYAPDRAGRHAEMVQVCDAALLRLAKPAEGPAYGHADAFPDWIHANRARALVGLGRIDEAAAVLEAARGMSESGGQHVIAAKRTSLVRVRRNCARVRRS